MRLAVLILTSCLEFAPAKAEFLILSPPEAPKSQRLEPPAPQPKPKHLSAKASISTPDAALSGFGERVPLTFAVRQIVPPRFQVVYAESVHQDDPVDWKGGERWQATLADAVRPLGLVVSVRASKVTIAAAPAH
jgi:hypothetical protein